MRRSTPNDIDLRPGPRSRGGRGTQAALIAAAVSVGLGQSVLFVLLPLLVETTGLGPSELSAAMATGMLLFAVGGPYWGRRSDRIGRRRALGQALLGYGAGAALLALAVVASEAGLIGPAACLFLLVVSRVVHGLTASGVHPIAQAWAADLFSAGTRLAAFGRIGAAVSLGRLLGPALVSAFLVFGILVPLLPVVAAPLAALAILWLSPGSDGAAMRAPPPSGMEPPPRPWRERFAMDRPLVPHLVFGHACHTGLGLVQFTVGLLMQERLGLTGQGATGLLGVMTAGAAVLMVAVQLALLPRLASRPRPAMAGSAGVLALACLGLAAAGHWTVFAVGLAAASAASVVLVPGNASAGMAAVPKGRQGAAAGLLVTANTFGYGTGALLAGPGLEADPALPALGCAAIAVLLAVMALRHRAPPATVRGNAEHENEIDSHFPMGEEFDRTGPIRPDPAMQKTEVR